MSTNQLDKKISEVLSNIRSRDLYPDIRVINGRSTGDKVIIDNKENLLFCGYDYLGLSTHPKIVSAYKDALDLYGTQSGGTPLVSGTLDIHKKAEKRLAEFFGSESAMLFTSGALANIGIIPALMSMPAFSAEFFIRKFLFLQQKSFIFSDELNHATIVDGCRLAKANIVVYKHKDLHDLEQKLKMAGHGWKLIVTDGVFSMDGDIAPLPKLVEIAKKNNSWLMVDDAHSVGVLGEKGKGTAEHFGLSDHAADITVGALGKAVSILGGYAAISNELSEYFRVTVRPAIFSGSLPPPATAGLLASIDIVEHSNSLRLKLWSNAARLRGGLKEAGYDTLMSEDPTPIIPLMIGEDKKAILISRELQERGIFAPAIRWPAVPKNTARIRFTVQSNNTEDDIDFLLLQIKELDAKYSFTKKVRSN